MSVYVIAEAGVNHNGSLALAKDLVRAASECGADAVKFQTFVTDKLVTHHARKAAYQDENDAGSSTQADMLRRLELGYDDYVQLSRECEKYNIDFMTSCFDSDSLAIIVETTAPGILKVGSGDLTNLPFLIEHARTGVGIIISTGMATLSEVEDALAALAFGYLSEDGTAPSSYRWLKLNYFTSKAMEQIRSKVTILHCVTDYPARAQDLNLNAIRQLREAYGFDVGYSDHSLGIEACCAAVALGATCLEKHITLDKNMAGPDHAASSTPGEFKNFVGVIRNLEQALRPGVKAPSPREQANLEVARKYLVAAKDIAAGEPFTEENVAIKRSAIGLMPNQYWDTLGKTAPKAYSEGDGI